MQFRPSPPAAALAWEPLEKLKTCRSPSLIAVSCVTSANEAPPVSPIMNAHVAIEPRILPAQGFFSIADVRRRGGVRALTVDDLQGDPVVSWDALTVALSAAGVVGRDAQRVEDQTLRTVACACGA